VSVIWQLFADTQHLILAHSTLILVAIFTRFLPLPWYARMALFAKHPPLLQHALDRSSKMIMTMMTVEIIVTILIVKKIFVMLFHYA
jgi:hypothetical protein